MKTLIFVLTAVTSMPAFAEPITLNCVFQGSGDTARFSQHYQINIDPNGTLLSVDGVRARFKELSKVPGEKSYLVERKTFWFRPKQMLLRRFDANGNPDDGDGHGNFFYACH